MTQVFQFPASGSVCAQRSLAMKLVRSNVPIKNPRQCRTFRCRFSLSRLLTASMFTLSNPVVVCAVFMDNLQVVLDEFRQTQTSRTGRHPTIDPFRPTGTELRLTVH